MDLDAFVNNFNGFFTSTNLSSTLEYFGSMCQNLQVDPSNPRPFLTKAHACLRDSRLFRLKGLVQKYDRRISHSTYASGPDSKIADANVLIIGSGPAGLRTAIECVFIGCKNVVVIEKRSEFSRNNIVHLWSFVIRDLIELGAKIFFPKFCTGDLDHISIKLLQLILLKIGLLLGVRFFASCEFSGIDSETCRPNFNSNGHNLNEIKFDVIVGASGARSVLPGFTFAEDRRALAIGITANFKNKSTLPEQQASEISGVARQFNAQFFDELNSYSGIDIENLVYYKGDTHYFVCTARKTSLLMKGVLINDFPETDRLLARSNISQYNLCNYMRELANICTAMTIPDLEYEMCGDCEDTAVFDFTSSCYAKHSSRAIVKSNGAKVLMCLVGDSLRLPFWPEGTGCPRGFLSSYDTAWIIQKWFQPDSTPIECIALRECVYGLYSSTKPDVLYKSFTELERFNLDPQTRYRQLDLSTAHMHLPKARALIDGVIVVPEAPFAFLSNENISTRNSKAINGRVKRVNEGPRPHQPGFIPDKLTNWCLIRLKPYNELLPNIEKELSFCDGMALCCLIHSIRPDAIDLFNITPGPLAVETFLNAVFREFTIVPQLTSSELMSGQNHHSLVRLLLQLYAITSHTERVAAAAAQRDDFSRLDTAAKAQKLKEIGRGLRQQRKTQIAVDQLLFGGKELSLEEKKMKLKELFLLGQQGNSSPNNAPQDPTAVTPQEFEERKSRIQGLFDGERGESSCQKQAVEVEMSESLRDRRDLLVRKLMGQTEPAPQTQHKADSTRVYNLLSSNAKRNQPVDSISGNVDISLTSKKLLTSLSSSYITDEQKKIAAALFETRLLGQRRQPDGKREVLNRGPPPVKNVPHLTIGDRKKQLINSNKGSISRSAKPHPDESAHIPVLELKDRLGIACDTNQPKAFDPVEKSQMPISELAKRIATSANQAPVERKPEYQIVNQDYQPTCYVCSDRLYVTERMMVGQYAVHRDCFRCVICRRLLRWTNYAAVENETCKRTVFICPGHVETKEVQEYFARCSEIMGSVHFEVTKKTTPQLPTPSEEKPQSFIPELAQPIETGSNSGAIAVEDDIDLYYEVTDDEDLEGFVSSSIEDMIELEEIESESEKESDDEPKVDSRSQESSAHTEESCEKASTKRDEASVAMQSAVKIDSWLHQQLVNQRQSKIIAAKQAFLASSEPTSLPLPMSPDFNSTHHSLAVPMTQPSNQATSKLKSDRGELEMECDSDTAAEDQKSSPTVENVEVLAKDYVDQLIISVSGQSLKGDGDAALLSPSSSQGGVKGMFSKITRSIDASLAKLSSKHRTSSQPPSPNPTQNVEITNDEHTGDELDESKPKWRRFASNLFPGNWTRSQRTNSNGSAESNQPISPSKGACGNSPNRKGRPDSIDEMLFVNGNGNGFHGNGNVASENHRQLLEKFVCSEENQQTRAQQVEDVKELLSEHDSLEVERTRLEEDIVLIERAHHVNSRCKSAEPTSLPKALQEALAKQSLILQKQHELLVKARLIEVESSMDDLMQKYVNYTQDDSTRNGQVSGDLMHQMALLATSRDELSQMVNKSAFES